jgi:hypothetical protein
MDEFGCIALILESVVEESVAHADQTLLRSLVNSIPELLEPHPVVRVASLSDAVLKQLVNNVDVVNDVQNERLHLDKDEVVAAVVEGRVAFKLSLQVTLVVLQLALFDGLDAVSAEVDHLTETADL